MARIIVTTAEGERQVELDPGQTVTIGRDATNRIPLEGAAGVSRRHCRIGPREEGESGWEVVDLGSTNGTRVGGQKVKQRALAPGDVVEVGSVRILFEDPEEAGRLEKLSQDGVCFLEWVAGDRKGERVSLEAKRVTIGRRDANALTLDDRMVSGHHAEIDRDLNGYTIRDLGSTNGTLVSGEPISEALLTHGSRVRIGNSRFVFKDPSMKDVEVALDTMEEDEGWGMMGEIDLSRSRGSKAGILVILLLFAAAGAGGWWLSQQEDEGSGVGDRARNLVENGDFDDEDVYWGAERVEGVDLRLNAKGGSPGAWLMAKNSGEEADGPVTVLYEQPFETAGMGPLRLQAKVRKQGAEGGSFVVVWASDPSADEAKAGVTPLVRTDVIEMLSGGWSSVSAEVLSPPWARTARIGVRLPVGAGAGLDSIFAHLQPLDTPRVTLDVPSFKAAYVDDTGALELLANKTILLTAVRPMARLADGTVLSGFKASGTPEAGAAGAADVTLDGTFPGPDGEVKARVKWIQNAEGLRVELACDGAVAVGLEARIPSANLGPTVNVLGDFLPQSIPLGKPETVAKVSRTLVGEAAHGGLGVPTLLAFVQDDQRPVAELEFGVAEDAGLAVFKHWIPGGSTGAMQIVTDFTGQRREAQADLDAARQRESSRPGVAIGLFRETAIKWPFEKEIRDEALQRAVALETQATADALKLTEALTAFRVYRSADALDAMEILADKLSKEYLGEGAPEGNFESEVTALVEQVQASRGAYEVEVAAPGVDRLERLYTLLQNVKGYRAMSALYARALQTRYERLSGDAPDIARRVQAASEALKALEQEAGITDALPPVPENP